MGRRSKSDIMGLNQRIVDLHDETKLTHEQIAGVLRAEGKDLSRESVRRSYNNSARKAEKYKIASESCKVILDGVKDGSDLDMVQAANSILTGMMYDKILEMDDLDFGNPAEFIRALKSLSDVQVRVSQFRLNFDRGVAKARAAIYDSLAAELAGEPELLKKLGAIVAKAEVRE